MPDIKSFTRGRGLLEGYLSKKRAEKASSLIDEGLTKRKILDIGCGFYPFFLTSIDFKEKYGIDPSLKSLNVDKIKLSKADVTKKSLPFENNFFDVVTLLAVFEHLDNNKLDFVISETHRVLNKNGVLIITTPAPWADKLLHFMARFGLISSEEIHEHKHHHSKQKIENIIEKMGFEKNRITSGYFELGLNMWFKAIKK
jgi:ubiquinone/menaquinone biosynthesis C-methylase UbiE